MSHIPEDLSTHPSGWNELGARHRRDVEARDGRDVDAAARAAFGFAGDAELLGQSALGPVHVLDAAYSAAGSLGGEEGAAVGGGDVRSEVSVKHSGLRL